MRLRRRCDLLAVAFGRGQRNAEIRDVFPPYSRLVLMPDDWEGRFLRSAYKGAMRAVLYKAMREGEVERPGRCEDCGVECTPDAHHEDYDRPLSVRWLCKPCHYAADVARRARERRARDLFLEAQEAA